MSSNTFSEASTVLYVDDEQDACKWLARTLRNEFTVMTAGGVSEALDLLQRHTNDIALLVTDFRMPQRDGLELLRAVQQQYPHIIRLLSSAYVDKDVAIAAVNEGRVFRILEKPLDEAATRTALREGLAEYRQRARDRVLHENRSTAMRETLGFLAHELNTPLVAVRAYMTGLRKRLQPEGIEGNSIGAGGKWPVLLHQRRPGEVAAALDGAERCALHCQSLVATFVQSARDAYPGTEPQTIAASALVKSLLDDYPFEPDERAFVTSRVECDFVLPGRRDLLYLVLSTLTKNALQALQGRPQAKLSVVVGRTAEGSHKPSIYFEDNGPGIAPELLSRLTREPVASSNSSGGSGMGLVFCRSVVQSMGGDVDVTSALGHGTTVTLSFPPFTPANAGNGTS